jgi:hypothetical protein
MERATGATRGPAPKRGSKGRADKLRSPKTDGRGPRAHGRGYYKVVGLAWDPSTCSNRADRFKALGSIFRKTVELKQRVHYYCSRGGTHITATGRVQLRWWRSTCSVTKALVSGPRPPALITMPRCGCFASLACGRAGSQRGLSSILSQP